MAKEKKSPKEPEAVPQGTKLVVFMLVQKVGEQPSKGGVIVSQDIAVIENGQLVRSEQTDQLDPSGFGAFIWRDDHPNHKRRMVAMTQFAERKNKGAVPFIVGPFDSMGKAAKAMQKVRPKSSSEQISELVKENDAQSAKRAEDQELIERLKRQIASAQNQSK